MNNTTEIRIAIASIRQLLAAIERQVITGEITQQDLEVLASLETQVGKASDWLLGNTPHAPQTRVELPKETFVRRELEKELWPLASRRAPQLIGGVSID
jgi:hypothetical protein